MVLLGAFDECAAIGVQGGVDMNANILVLVVTLTVVTFLVIAVSAALLSTLRPLMMVWG